MLARTIARAVLALVALALIGPAAARAEEYDVVVYGGTSAGVIAAVQAAHMGKHVCLVHPGKHLGGLTSGGLGATDIGNKEAIGGLSREFYRRVGKHYGEPEAFHFEPHVAEQVYDDWAREAGVVVVKETRLDLAHGVDQDPKTHKILSIVSEDGKKFAAQVFIDASYEGDLMAKAGVSYTVGREANAQYDETIDGVQPGVGGHHFKKAIDPYVKPGDKSSGLLPGIEQTPIAPRGSGDKHVQAYNFRLCLTENKANQLPFPKPAGYEPVRYELLLRYLNAGVFDVMGNNQKMPNGKTDMNNNGAISTDDIGMNWAYPDADYAERAKIFQEHINWQQGLMWFLANDPRVPAAVHEKVNHWGLCKDEFQDTGGWGHELYVREARRMVSDYVMTQHNCQGKTVAADSVALGSYGMDSHHSQRYVDAEGHVRNEGDVEVGKFSPYPISYASMTPKESQCPNLLVPVCLSASHMGYGSIRMEPVFMMLGQSAATAACLAIDDRTAVQHVPYDKLKARLLADKQILIWTGPRGGHGSAGRGIDPAKLPGIVVDAAQAHIVGEWEHGTATAPYVGAGYLHDQHADKGKASVTFTTKIPKAGAYEVRIAYGASGNRATDVPVTVTGCAEGGPRKSVVDQRKPAPIEGLWFSLGTFDFDAGATASVEISDAGTDGVVIANAAQWLAK